MEDQHFWDDAKESAKVIKEVKSLKSTIEAYEKLEDLYEDVETLIEMGYEEEDESIVAEVKESYEQLEKSLDDMTVSTLLSDEYDKDNAILTIHAGAGGTESCDWANMLYRMYCRYADSKGFSYEVLDFLDGDEAGYKSVTIQISGENAYGYLKSERGVHRLVRISPFNAAGKRQTSFVSCDVMPDIDDDIDIEIKDDDLKIDTYRAGGAGGQHVNKTSSAVRINRDEEYVSNIAGIYPCGEGAGYAGGITTSAIDGIKVAEAIISKYIM